MMIVPDLAPSLEEMAEGEEQTSRNESVELDLFGITQRENRDVA